MTTVIDTRCEHLRTTVDDDGIATIVFDNPTKHNAMNGDMLDALARICAQLAVDESVHVVVVTGGGDKAFISGADIGQLANGGLGTPGEADATQASIGSLRAIGKPVIAMIHGWCLGGGVMVALDADIRICSTDAVFGIPAARLGVGYPHSATSTLVALIGPGWAAEILYSGRRVDAAEAERIGLVNRAVPRDRLESEVMDLARTIAGNAPLSHRAHQASIRAAVSGLDDELARVDEAIASAWASEDFIEGGRAFIERRDPRFTGR